MHRKNADDVKVGLVLALARLGIGAQVEVTLKSVYGRFRADVAVLNAKKQVLVIAEAKRKRQELTIRQRTSYAKYGCPAYLVLPRTIQIVAESIWEYIVNDMEPSRMLTIDVYTYAGGDVNGDPWRGQLAFNRRIVRG